MRYPAEQKAETHRRIVSTAARAFRERGFDGLGIADLMQESGLTQGGFYRHFDSKEDLYATALTLGLQQMADRMVNTAKSAPKGQAVRSIIELYLSLGHLDSVGNGCVIAALAPEVRRQSAASRRKINAAMQSLMKRLIPFVAGASEAEKMQKAYLLISGMAGVLMTVRAMPDAKARKQMLTAAQAFYIGAFAEARVN